MSEADKKITAYRILRGDTTPLVPAPPFREWMEDTKGRHAYKCLPMVVANQYGWVILNQVGCTVAWNGGVEPHDVAIEYWTGQEDFRINSNFGSGILTFQIPYLFRTPPGVNLWVKGPSNQPKDGIWPLEGIVETDWTSATFTMNWRFTRVDHAIHFAVGEPICMVVPIQRWLAESLEPSIELLDNNAEVRQQYDQWSKSRDFFNTSLKTEQWAQEQGWQKDYFKGKGVGGDESQEHQTHIDLKPFVERTKPS